MISSNVYIKDNFFEVNLKVGNKVVYCMPIMTSIRKYQQTIKTQKNVT